MAENLIRVFIKDENAPIFVTALLHHFPFHNSQACMVRVFCHRFSLIIIYKLFVNFTC